MRVTQGSVLILSLLGCLGGCDQRQAASDMERTLEKARAEVQQKASEARQEEALARAQAEYDRAVSGCRALRGTARTKCQKDALDELDRARAAAAAAEFHGAPGHPALGADPNDQREPPSPDDSPDRKRS